MRLKKRKLYGSEKCSVIIAGIIIVMFFLPWFSLEGGRHTVLGYFRGIDELGGIREWIAGMNLPGAESDGGLEMLQSAGIFLKWICMGSFIYIPLYFLYGILRFLGKKVYAFEVVLTIGGFGFAFTAMTFSVQIQIFAWYLFMIFLVQGLEFLIRRVLEDWEEAKQEGRRVSLRLKCLRLKQAFIDWTHREHKKNSPLLYVAAWKNFKSNWRNFMLFFSTSIVSVTLLFSVIGVQQMLTHLNLKNSSGEQADLTAILQFSIYMIIVIGTFMVAFTARYYIGSRLKDYGIFLTIGIQSRTLGLFVILEYVGSMLFALIGGVIIGNVLTVLLWQFLRQVFSLDVAFPQPEMYLSVLKWFVVLLLASATATYQVMSETDLSVLEEGGVGKDKLVSSKRGVYIFLGAICTIGGIWVYSRRYFSESPQLLILFLLGVFLLIRHIGSFFLEQVQKRRKFYYRNIVAFNHFYYRFKKNSNQAGVMFIVHFFMLFYLSVQLLSSVPKNDLSGLFPYDEICIVDTAPDEQLDRLAKNYNAKIQKVPMLRLSVPDCTRAMEDNSESKYVPQGQNIGISESTYQSLERTDLHLEGKEIFISFQQNAGDYAHPLEFSRLEESPLIRVGDPLFYYKTAEREQIFSPDYILKGEERNIIIGYLGKGLQENIVVYSDEEFNKLYGGEEGSKWLLLANVPKEKQKEAKAGFEQFAKENTITQEDEMVYDSSIQPVYHKIDKLDDTKSEKMLQLIVYMTIMAAMLFNGVFILFIRMQSELPEFQAKGVFLTCLGMPKKEQYQSIVREIYTTCALPAVLAAIGSACFWEITMWLRFFTMAERSQYRRWEICIMTGYLVIHAGATYLLKRHIIKKLEETNYESH